MEFFYQRSYRGSIKAVVLDLEGTLIDYGGLGFTQALIELFHRHQVTIEHDQAHTTRPLSKAEHLRRLFALPSVANQWVKQHKNLPNEATFQQLHDELEDIQRHHLPQLAQLLPGVATSLKKWQDAGILIAVVTHETRSLLDLLLDAFQQQHFTPDLSLCIEDLLTPAHAPSPWLIAQSAMLLGIYPWESIVAIGDTVADVEAGLNAGTWTVGIAQTGREMGLSATDIKRMSEDEREEALEAIHHRLYRSGAHFVVNTFEQCNAVLDEIQDRLNIGIRPA